MIILAMAAEEELTLKPPIIKKRDCHPELLSFFQFFILCIFFAFLRMLMCFCSSSIERLVACGTIALEQDDEEEVKRIRKIKIRNKNTEK